MSNRNPSRNHEILTQLLDRMARVESKLTRLLLACGLDEHGKQSEKPTPCQMHDFDSPREETK